MGKKKREKRAEKRARKKALKGTATMQWWQKNAEPAKNCPACACDIHPETTPQWHHFSVIRGLWGTRTYVDGVMVFVGVPKP